MEGYSPCRIHRQILFCYSGYVVDNLSPGTTYYVVVRTYTPAHGEQQNNLWSEYSQEVSATTTAQAALIFEDDFSTDKGWTDESSGNIYRDAANEQLVWQVRRDDTRRYYIHIDAKSDYILRTLSILKWWLK